MQVIIQLLPFLVRLAEMIFTQEKAGPVKKDFVMGIARTGIAAMQAVSKGGQAETWSAVKTIVDGSVEDAVSTVINLTTDNDPDYGRL